MLLFDTLNTIVDTLFTLSISILTIALFLSYFYNNHSKYPIPHPYSPVVNSLHHLNTTKQMNFICTAFKLDREVATMLQASWMTDLIHECLCTECGKHVDPETSTYYIVEHMHEYTTDPKEQQYIMLMWGYAMADEGYWRELINHCKRDEKIDTCLAIKSMLNEFYDSIISKAN